MGRSGKTPQGLATRARIVEVATEMFLERGYVATTVAAIAKGSGVSAQAVYLAFGSKTAILKAAVDIAAAGDADEIAMAARPWMDQARACPDFASTLDIIVENAAASVERSSPIYEVIRRASADPEVAELTADITAQRLQSARDVVGLLWGKSGLHPDRTFEEAVAIGYALISPEIFRLLVTDCGWAVPQWRSFLHDSLANQLELTTPD